MINIIPANYTAVLEKNNYTLADYFDREKVVTIINTSDVFFLRSLDIELLYQLIGTTPNAYKRFAAYLRKYPNHPNPFTRYMEVLYSSNGEAIGNLNDNMLNTVTEQMEHTIKEGTSFFIDGYLKPEHQLTIGRYATFEKVCVMNELLYVMVMHHTAPEESHIDLVADGLSMYFQCLLEHNIHLAEYFYPEFPAICMELH